MTNQEYEVLHSTDWLGVNLVFYNSQSGDWSPDLNELIDHTNIVFNEEGLQSYLLNGFVMFGLTPIENIFYTLPNTVLIRNSRGELKIITNPDPIIPLLDRQSSIGELDNLLKKWFFGFDREISNTKETVILPRSGGYDSRMLASYLKDKSYVRTYSYGISINQEKSYEVSLARAAAKSMNLKWEQIKLGDFHKYLNENFETYSVSTHAHSMYHFEFYSKIIEAGLRASQCRVLSGIYADVWAGSWEFPNDIHAAEDLSALVRNYGINLGIAANIIIPKEQISFFEANQGQLQSHKYRILTAARLKAPLIRHLIETPRRLGLKVSSPFFEPEIVACMLNLPKEDRNSRKWQRAFIEREYGKERKFRDNRSNNSDFMGTQRIPPPKLELDLLPENFPYREQLKKEEWGTIVVTHLDVLIARLGEIPGFKRLFPVLNKFQSNFNAKYANYVTLYPIVKLIKLSQKTLER